MSLNRDYDNTPDELLDVNKNGKSFGCYPYKNNMILWINDDMGGNRVQVEVSRKDLETFLQISLEADD